MTTPSRRLTAAALLLLCGGALAAFSAEAPSKKGPDPALVSAFEGIRQAFRTRQVAPLSPILSQSGKVYLSVKIFAAEPGFYSRDQIEALLKQAFAALQTVKFHINMDLFPDAAEERSVVVCPAVWSYIGKGIRTDLNLRFLLARDPDHWMLGEIRETR